MKCARCDCALVEGARFCPECGYPAAASGPVSAAPEAVPETMPEPEAPPPEPVSTAGNTESCTVQEPMQEAAPEAVYIPPAVLDEPEPEPVYPTMPQNTPYTPPMPPPDTPHVPQIRPTLPPDASRRPLKTSEILFVELVAWIPVLNVILFLSWMLSKKRNLARARIVQAKLLFFVIAMVAVTGGLAALAAMVYYGILDRSPFPAIIWP